MYGNEYGTGYCSKYKLQSNQYMANYILFREMNFLVCKIGVGVGVAGDAIFVPFRQTSGETSGDMKYMKPGY